jgi:TolB-like protein/Tfp pilus assembly protein PilF
MESGTLASFSSIIDAVMCAMSIQKATEELNIPVRIGIHQGEVIFEEKDVLGDGVNIASRIQNAINTRGIVISEKVYSDIKNKEGIEIEFLVKQALKGVDKPVGIYKVSCGDDSLLDFSIDTGELIRPMSFGRTTIVFGILVIALLAFALYYFLPKIINLPSEQEQSVLVLPFTNYTSDTLDYFVEGMHDILIGNVGKIGALRVLGQTTANAYKGTEKSLTEIAKELGVNTFVEGSVLCLGDSVCLQIKVMGAHPQEKQLWVHDFKVEKSQILSLYNMVTKGVSDEIGIILTPEEERLLAKSRAVDREAYDAYLRSYQHWDDLSQESLNKAREYLNLAIEKDPDFAPCYDGLAQVWAGLAQLGFEAPEVARPKIHENLNKAIELDPDYPGSHYTKAIIGVWVEWDWEKGEREFLKALELNPNDVWSRIYYAHLLYILKRYDEAYFHSQMAAELDPMNPLVLGLSAMVDESLRTPQALEKCKKALEIDPEHHFALCSYAEATYFNGDYKNSIETDLKTLQGLDDEAREDIMAVFQDKGYVEAIRTMLSYMEEYAKTNYINHFEMGEYYWKAGNLEKSIEWYVKAYEMREQMMPYITLSEIGFDDIKDDPRIISIIEEMNLPFE